MNKRLIKWGAGISALGLVLLLDALFFEKYFFEVKTYPIGNKEGTKSLRLLLITDLHLKNRFWPYYKKLASTINKIQPDLILIAGDTFDGDKEAKPVIDFLSMLDTQAPKAAIMGNHEYKSPINTSRIRQIYERFGVDLLIDQTKAYTIKGERIVVTGLDDFVESEGCLERALKGVGREDHHLMLIHSPLQQEQVLEGLEKHNSALPPHEQVSVRYIFAGHNHGGQVRAFGFAPKRPPMAGEYLDGWYNEQSPHLFVSKGFGTSTVPFRFGARSEVVRLEYFV